MMEMLKKKTTWVGLAAVILGFADLIWGDNPEAGIAAILAGFGTITMRHAIAKGK